VSEQEPFGDRATDAEGNLRLTPVVRTEAQRLRAADLVVFRIEMTADERHLAAIEAGTMKPVGLQLRLDPEAARRCASKLDLAADRAQGRAPRRRNG
jgi:hypothetical protein